MKWNMQTIDGNTAATHVAYGMSEKLHSFIGQRMNISIHNAL